MNRIILNETSYHGAGAVKEIVNELAHRGLKKPIVFSDPDLIKFGVTKKVTDLLDKAKVKYAVYSEIKPNPTIANVKNGVKAFKAAKADCIIAIGGGSSMDTAKAVGIIIANPKFADVRSLEGVAPTKNPSKPILAVPTTAGTAAEVTINYVITDVEKKRKFVCVDPHDIPVVAFVDPEMMATMPNNYVITDVEKKRKFVCVDPHDIPVVAFVDPEMMATMPKGLTAFTGMDALTHAIEGYITKAACPMTDMMHLEAIRLISLHLRDAVANKPSGREGMALGQYIAGMGFSNVGLGIDHAMAHGLSALYDMPHGKACAILLPVAMKFNAPASGTKYRNIAAAMGVKGADRMTVAQARKAAIAAVEKLAKDVGIPADLKGVLKKEDVRFLAESAYADACRPGNPREVDVKQIEKLYLSLV